MVKPEIKMDNHKMTIEECKEMIQRHYDAFNWYGYNAEHTRLDIAAQLTIIEKEGKKFEPVYNCAQ